MNEIKFDVLLQSSPLRLMAFSFELSSSFCLWPWTILGSFQIFSEVQLTFPISGQLAEFQIGLAKLAKLSGRLSSSQVWPY